MLALEQRFSNVIKGFNGLATEVTSLHRTAAARRDWLPELGFYGVQFFAVDVGLFGSDAVANQ